MADYGKFKNKILSNPSAKLGYDERKAAIEAAGLVREWRGIANLTQQQLAERTGKTQEAISRIEAANSANGPYYGTLSAIAEACELEMRVTVVKRRISPDAAESTVGL